MKTTTEQKVKLMFDLGGDGFEVSMFLPGDPELAARVHRVLNVMDEAGQAEAAKIRAELGPLPGNRT